MNRRYFIKVSAAAALGGAVGVLPGVAPAGEFRQRLVAGAATHRFEAAQAEATSVLAFNGSIPGPVLRLAQGVESEIQFVNRLGQDSSIHWHGLRIDNAMDGVPGMTQQPVPPGGEFVYRFTPPDAGTYWYHSHQRSWEQMALGLAGILIVEEREAPAFHQDLVFAIDDWRVDDSLQIDRRSLGSLHDWAHGGRLGNFATVNGVSVPGLPVVSGQRIRLRLVNIANARIMTLAFPPLPAWIVALDGQPVAPRELVDGQITLAPGQRADLVIDMAGAPGSEAPVELLLRDERLRVAVFRYGDERLAALTDEPPAPLPPNPVNRIELPADAAFRRVPLRLEGGAMGGMRGAVYQGRELGFRELARAGQVWAINGVAGLAEEPLFRVARGSAVSLEVDNDNAWPHGVHVHGHHFVDSRDPGAWRDVALFGRGERGSLRFIADNPGKWLIHCHMNEHMAGGMLTWFEVS